MRKFREDAIILVNIYVFKVFAKDRVLLVIENEGRLAVIQKIHERVDGRVLRVVLANDFTAADQDNEGDKDFDFHYIEIGSANCIED